MDVQLFSSRPKKAKKARAAAAPPRELHDGPAAALNTDDADANGGHTVSQPAREGQAQQATEEGGEGFRALGLNEWLDKVCASLGMRHPTEVQRGCIPAVLAGRNVIGVAHTGSGKTAAFALPILQRLAKNPYGVFALVLTPTRCVWREAGERGGSRRQQLGSAGRGSHTLGAMRVPALGSGWAGHSCAAPAAAACHY